MHIVGFVIILYIYISYRIIKDTKGLITIDISKTNKLKNEIEETRIELVNELKMKEMSNQKIISISQNLDKLIAEYMKKTTETKKVDPDPTNYD